MTDDPPRTLRLAPHVATFGVGWALLTYSAVPTFVIARYDTTLTTVGLFMTAPLAMVVVAQAPVGKLVSSYSTTTVLSGVLLCFAAISGALDLAPTLGVALALRAAMGLAAGLALSTGATHLSRLFTGRAAARQQGIYGGMVTLGGAAGFLVAPTLVRVAGGVGLHAVGGLLGLAAAAMLLANRGEPRTSGATAERDGSPFDVLRNPVVVAGSVCYAATLGSYITLSTFITAYFADLGVVGPLNAFVLVLATVGRGAGGVVSTRLSLSDERFTRLAAGVAAATFLAMLLPGRAIAVTLPLVAMVAVSLPFGSVYNFSAAATDYDGSALAFVIAVGNGAAAVLPAVTGYVRTVTGDYRLAFLLIAALNVVAALSLVLAVRRTDG
ncbi:MAG: nitrate/nitrite transporter [Halobacteriales archaeon]